MKTDFYVQHEECDKIQKTRKQTINYHFSSWKTTYIQEFSNKVLSQFKYSWYIEDTTSVQLPFNFFPVLFLSLFSST